MQIIKLVSNLLDSNTFILEKEREVLIVDCGVDVEKVKNLVGDKKVEGILLTHGHFDHSAYCNQYAKEFNCNIFASDKIKDTLTDKIAIYSEDYSIISDFSNFNFIENDCRLNLGAFEVKCCSFPGHSPCCMGYVIDEILFAGDFIFAKSFGRVDLKNGSKKDMIASLDNLKNVEFDRIYSGHGEESTKEEQLRNINLYKRFLTRYTNF